MKPDLSLRAPLLHSAVILALGLILRPSDVTAQCAPDRLFQTLVNPAPATGDRFGTVVAMDGNLVAAGSTQDDGPANDSGRVYVFELATGALISTLDNPTGLTNQIFATSLAISGSNVVVGAPLAGLGGVVYVFDAVTGSLVSTIPNPSPAASDDFGRSVAIDGARVVVGAPGDDTATTDAGIAYVFDATSGSLTSTLPNPSPVLFDGLGVSVSISGNLAIVGAPADDNVFTDVGAAYVYNADSGAVVRGLSNPFPASGDRFGNAVAISGNVALVGTSLDDAGAVNSGSAYLFNVTTGLSFGALNNPSPAVADSFGYAVALTADIAAVSAPFDDTAAGDSGTIYFYRLSAPHLLQGALTHPGAGAGELFGLSIAMSGSFAVGGAYVNDTGATDAGIAYTSTCFGLLPTPSPAATATPTPSPDPTPTPTPSPDPSATPSPDATATATASPNPTATASPEPTATPTYTPTPAPPTSSPTATPPAPTPSPTVSPCCPGDADNSGSFVDANDFIAVQANFGADNGVGGAGDANCSGSFVDANDFIAVQANFGADCG